MNTWRERKLFLKKALLWFIHFQPDQGFLQSPECLELKCDWRKHSCRRWDCTHSPWWCNGRAVYLSVQRMIPTESLSSDRSRDQLPLLACSQVSPWTQIHRDRWGYPPVSMSPDSSQQVFVLLPYSLFHGRGEDVHREMNQAVVWVTGQTILKQCITYHISCIYYHQSLSEAHSNENSSI